MSAPPSSADPRAEEVPDRPPPYASVVFDCDSTLSTIEGIQELGRPEHAAELARLTDAAMEGELALEEVYGRRLELVRPSRDDVEAVGRRYVETLVPNAVHLVAALRALGKRVAIVSGGLLPAVLHAARALGVPAEDVEAVGVRWDASGAYAGFDEASPLARRGGKREVLTRLGARLPRPLALVGDGATDLEAAPLVERFVAFGGVERRAAVFAAARVSCAEPDFGALAPLLLAADEIERLRADSERHASLWPRGTPR